MGCEQCTRKLEKDLDGNFPQEKKLALQVLYGVAVDSCIGTRGSKCSRRIEGGEWVLTRWPPTVSYGDTTNKGVGYKGAGDIFREVQFS
jgi:hypothetical protein